MRCIFGIFVCMLCLFDFIVVVELGKVLVDFGKVI